MPAAAGIAFRPRPPGDGYLCQRVVGQKPLGRGGDGTIVFVNRDTWYVQIGQPIVQEAPPVTASIDFGLPLFAKEQHVMTGQQGDGDLGDDGVIVADDTRKQRSSAASFLTKLS